MPLAPHAFSARRQAVYAQQRHGEVPTPMKAIVWASFGTNDIHMASPDNPRERALIDMVADLCDARQISPVPPIYVAKTGILNAASVSGRGLVYTTGILNAMNPQQLAAVTGHELSHHRHSVRDLLLMVGIGVAGGTAVSLGLGFLARTALSSSNSLLRSTGSALDFITGAHIPQYLGVMAAVTPWRHYMELEADKEGAELTHPEHMKSALECLMKESHKPKTQVSERSWLNRVLRAVLNPFPSHPDTYHRIARIEAMPQERQV